MRISVMIPRYTYLLITVATNFTINAADPFKAHNEIIRKDRARSAQAATYTAQRYIQQGKPVPPMPFLPPHAVIQAQQHNARLAAQQSVTPQQNTAPAQQSDGIILTWNRNR